MRTLTIAGLALLIVATSQAQEPKLSKSSQSSNVVVLATDTTAAKRNEFTPSAIEQQLFDVANRERRKAGAPALAFSPLLMQAARSHSANMVRQGRLNHMLDGKGPAERLNEVDFAWSYCAENIAWGQRTPAEAINSWMQSPGHRANLLSPNCTEIGVAVASGADGQAYWTMVLARSR